MNGLLNRDQAAQVLGIAVATLDNWRCQNRGPVYLKIGAAIRYRGEDIQNFIAGCAIAPAPTGEKRIMRASNGKWYVRFVVDGVEYSQPTGLEATERNRRKVQQMEATARQLVLEGKANLLRLAAIPFSEAAAQFLNWAEGEYSGDSRKTYLRIRSSLQLRAVVLWKGRRERDYHRAH